MVKNSEFGNLEVRLVSDAPADKDEFGSHERVSNALVEIITKEIGRKTIGLEGPWGSGKSTVIKLLNKKIGFCKNVCFLVFDAWAHEGDPLRRSFLESVINVFLAKHWINDSEYWEGKKAELARRKKTLTTIKTPLLTNWGLFVLFLILLTPVGVAGLNGLLKFAFNENSPWWASSALIASTLAAVSLPTLFALCGMRYLDKWIKSKIEGKKFVSPINWGVFLNKETTSETNDVIENPEPTSLEFETTFFELLGNGLDECKKLVIVIDNLDRVPPSDALAIWSTLRSFLEHREQDNKTFLNNLWVIIPYDIDGIRNIWSSEEKNNAFFATSFLDKLFQIRLFVPTPVLSDWRQYLLDLLIKAFPFQNNEELQKVSDLYGIEVEEKRKLSPTPRDLKLFVNGIGAIQRQWKGSKSRYPLLHIAFYYLLRLNSAETVRKTILKEDEKNYLSEEQTRLLGDIVYDNLAGLFYNVEVEKARQIILKEPIEKALLSNSSDTLVSLEKKNIGFWYVIDENSFKLFKLWATKKPNNICRAAKNLVSSGLINYPQALKLKEVLIDSVSEISRFESFSPEIEEGIQSLIAINKDPQFVKNICSKIPKLLKTENESVISTQVSDWGNAGVKLIEYLKEQGLLDSVNEGIMVTDDFETYVKLCNVLGEIKVSAEHNKILKADIPLESISNQLIQKIKNASLPWGLYNIFMVIKEQEPKLDFKPIVEALDQRLKSVVNSNEAHMIIEYMVYFKHWNIEEAAEYVDIYINQGYILHFIFQAQNQGNYQSFGTLLFHLINENRNVIIQGNYGNAQGGASIVQQLFQTPQNYQQIIESFIDKIKEYEKYDLLMEIVFKAKITFKFVTESLVKIVNEDCFYQVLNSKSFMLQSNCLRDNMKIENYKSVLDKLQKKTDLIKYIINNNLNYEYSKLYNELLDYTSNSLYNEFRNWCANKLNEISNRDWINHLKETDDTMRLLLKLADSGYPIELNYNYIDAIVSLGNSMLEETPKEELMELWKRLLSLLTTIQKTKVYENLAENLLKRKPTILTAEYLKLFGEPLILSKTLITSQYLIKNILIPILQARDIPSVEWVIRLLATKKAILSKEDEDLDELKERLKSLDKENILAGDSQITLSNIAATLQPEIDEEENTMSE